MKEANYIINPKKLAELAGKFTLNTGIITIICWVLMSDHSCESAAAKKKFRINSPVITTTVAFYSYTETEPSIIVMLSLPSYLGIISTTVFHSGSVNPW